MKLLVIISTIDLKYKLGCTPAWWQLLKALHEIGNEVIVTPYLGGGIESLWWRTYENPCCKESTIFNAYLERKKNLGRSPSERGLFSQLARQLIKHYIKPKWLKHVFNILKREDDIDAILILNVPLNHIEGIPTKIKTDWSIPVAYYDGDMPTILPKYTVERGFKFNYYENVDISEYDAFFTNSKGVISELQKLGANRVYPLYWAVDPLLFTPIEIEKDIDVSFYGHGSELREKWMKMMITNPSVKMVDVNFSVGGGNFGIELGNAKLVGPLSYSAWRIFCCRSKINLNITRKPHTEVYASSTARPFELAAFGACIVSQPYKGIEEWFEIGKELLIVRSEKEAIETYKWLLDDDTQREELGRKARARVIREHTFQHRAEELINILRGLS
jgi:glycosyltransferase involved in cell wall biosynthesis